MTDSADKLSCTRCNRYVFAACVNGAPAVLDAERGVDDPPGTHTMFAGHINLIVGDWHRIKPGERKVKERNVSPRAIRYTLHSVTCSAKKSKPPEMTKTRDLSPKPRQR